MKHNQTYFKDAPAVSIVQDGICLKSDREIIWQSLMSKARSLERRLEKSDLSLNQRLVVQDEYERTFALTGKYRRK